MNKMKLNIQLFAAAVTTSFSEPALTDANITSNKSTLTVNIYFSANNSSTWFQSRTLYCWVDGVEQSKAVGLSKGGSVSTSFTFNNIAHNADGTKTVEWEWYINTGTSVLGTLNPTGTRTLQTVPRASQPTLSSSSVNMGNSVTITTNRVSNSFTHTLSYSFGNASGTIASNVTDTTTWTPPITLANQIPNSTSGTATITCQTYNGTTLIGTKTVNLTLNVPSSVVPSASIGTLTEANSAMQTLNWGVFVQNKSQLNIPITASGSYNSTISSIVTTINGLSFTGANVTTSTLVTSGTNTISTTVTDSRGRTATATKTYTVVAYSNPSITTATAVRSTSNGTESDEGTYLKYTFVGAISSVSNHNAHTFRIGYKTTSGSTYTYTNIDTTNYSINKTNQVLNLNLSTNNSYDIIFEAVDTFMTSNIKRDISSGFDLMNFNASGKAMAIGKVSEASSSEELLEIAFPLSSSEKIETSKSLRIPKNSSAGYGLCNSDGSSIIKDYNNTNVTVDATGGKLFLGYANTTSLDLMNGKVTINSSGDITNAGKVTTTGNISSSGTINGNNVTINSVKILENGVTNSIYWEKRSDGFALCVGSKNLKSTSSRAQGGLTYYSAETNVTLPITFNATGKMFAFSNVALGNMNRFCNSYVNINSTSQIQLAYTNTTNNEERTIHFMVFGRWK